MSSKINSKKIRLTIKNEVDYKKEEKKGFITLGLINENTEFNLNAESIKSFNKLLFTDPSEYKITIKNSKIFYKNLAGDVLFISKIF